MSASVRQRILLGERQGQRVRFIGSGFGYEGDLPELSGHLCAMVSGFSLHAAIVSQDIKGTALKGLSATQHVHQSQQIG